MKRKIICLRIAEIKKKSWSCKGKVQTLSSFRQFPVITEKTTDIRNVSESFPFHSTLCASASVIRCVYTLSCQVGLWCGFHSVPGHQHPPPVMTAVMAACQVVLKTEEGRGEEERGGERRLRVLPCVAQCHGLTHGLSQTNTHSHAHTHTLICCQTWGQDGVSAGGRGDRVSHL